MTLDIRHDAIRRAGRTVLEAGAITVAAPAALAVVGINGSGKSSLFMQLTDTLASRGSAAVTLEGRRATLAYVPQSPGLPGWLRTERIADMYGLSFDALVEGMPNLHLAEIAGLRASTLSLGQRQALVIALALGSDADVTFLDEPFSALDFRRRLGTMDLLRERRDAGRGIVLSSQAATDLIELCTRFVVLRDGRYIFNGRRSDLGADADVREVELRLLHLLTMPV